MISGRVGSLIGSNFVGYLFDSYCELIFPLNAITYFSCAIVPMLLPKQR
jgi:hypothetical protein